MSIKDIHLFEEEEMNPTRFDVLIVYSSHFADSAMQGDEVKVPFGKRSKCELYNDVYGYFMQVCARKRVRVAFTSSNDIIGAGLCQGYWLIINKQWIKVPYKATSFTIFDKISPTTPTLLKQRNLLFSSPKVKPFNSPSIHALFIDKLKTYTSLKKFAIPTIEIKGTSIGDVRLASQALRLLVKKQRFTEDFSRDVIVKDRLGSSGNLIFKFAHDQYSEIAHTLQLHKQKSFVLQPFMSFDKGYLHHNERVAADIRLIYLRGKIIQTYTRIAKKDAFLCNEHQGGTLEYLKQSEIPSVVRDQAKKIMKTLRNNLSLFALDFVVSNDGHPYFLEGNTGPGLDWNPLIQKNIDKSKEFMRMIATELARRTKRVRSLRVKKNRVREILPKLTILNPEPSVSFLLV